MEHPFLREVYANQMIEAVDLGIYHREGRCPDDTAPLIFDFLWAYELTEEAELRWSINVPHHAQTALLSAWIRRSDGAIMLSLQHWLMPKERAFFFAAEQMMAPRVGEEDAAWHPELLELSQMLGVGLDRLKTLFLVASLEKNRAHRPTS